MYGQGGYGGFGGGFAPVKVGDELDVKIEAVGEKGDGIAKKDGFVLFVPGTRAGDEVRIRVTKVLRKVGFAEVVGQGQGAGKPEASKDSDEAEEEEEEPAAEDTENFGEDTPEPKEEEEPASGSEEPSEEPSNE